MKNFIKIINSVLVLTLSLILINCAAPQEDSSKISEAINKVNQAFMDAVAAGDAAAVTAHYTDDAQFLPSNMEMVVGKEAIQNAMQGFADAGMTGLKIETTEIEVHGDTAYEIGTFILSNSEDEEVDNGKYIVIWKKVGDEWKLHRDIFNSDMPVPTCPDENEDEGNGGDVEDTNSN